MNDKKEILESFLLFILYCIVYVAEAFLILFLQFNSFILKKVKVKIDILKRKKEVKEILQ